VTTRGCASYVCVWLVLLTTSAGCQSDDGPTLVRRTIGPEGGVIASHDDVLQLVILPGALSRTVEIEIEPSDVPPPIFGPAYRVRPDIDLEIDAEVTYRRVLPANPEGVAVAAIRREDYEHGAGSWVPLPVIELDIENVIVTGLDHELSLFYGMLEGLGGGTSSDTGTGDDTTTGDDETGSTDDGFGPLSHALDIQPIWDEHCVTMCHTPGGLNTDVVLTPDRALDDLLERFPVAATIPYVDPGNPDRSYLLYKLDGTQEEAPGGSGAPMPLGAPILSVEVRNMIEAWIEQGAPP
jgi:hypothetical protein